MPSHAIIAVAAALGLSCGGSTPSPEEPQAMEPLASGASALRPTGRSRPVKVPRAAKADLALGHHPCAAATDDEAVRCVIDQRRSAVRACYEDRLRTDQRLRGRLSVQLTIRPAGTVASAAAQEDTVGDPLVTTCVLSVLRDARFPVLESGPLTLAVPFAFAPGR